MESLQPGDPERVGGYRLVRRLGGGGMGQVFLGRSAGGRPVAVKLVRAEYGADAGFRRGFAVEVAAARRVGGFFTAQVVDADPEAERPWLVTAYVAGPTLRQAVAEHGPLPGAAVRVLGAGLAEGLAAIHDCDLVHRDLKPSNVILAADGPRVIDFGIARALEATSHTTTGVVTGTPAYMSPEQARGDRGIGPASDVFALGAVLAYAATGDDPFGAGHPSAMLYRVVQEQPDLSGVPGELRGLVTECLAKDPADRPSVREVLRRCAGDADTDDGWLPPRVAAMVNASVLPSESWVEAPSEVPAEASAKAPAGASGDTAATVAAGAAPTVPTTRRERRGLARLIPARNRRGPEPATAPPPVAHRGTAQPRAVSVRDIVKSGWNGLTWGATSADFRDRFPAATQQNGDWWVTGQGPEPFCGLTMSTQYGFNKRDRLYLVAFYPEVSDREQLPVAVLHELGAPDGTSTSWTVGDVTVQVKLAGVIATLTNRRVEAR